MQNAKDTFYEVLRGRLASINPARTTVVRGKVRPGLMVEENELPVVPVTPDCFRLRWTKAQTACDGVLPLVRLTCEVHYETAGTALGAGLDRGRCLAAMDGELVSVVTGAPTRAAKMSYATLAQGGTAIAMKSSIWWGAPVFAASEARGERLRRTATVIVMSYQEAGEL